MIDAGTDFAASWRMSVIELCCARVFITLRAILPGVFARRQRQTVAELTYDSLQREIARKLVGYTFARGQGGPLTLIWVLGIGVFMFVWPMVELAALWTIACLAFAALIFRDYLRSPKARMAVSKDILKERFAIDGIGGARYREAIEQGVDVFLELLRKLDNIKRSRGLDEDVANTAAEMGRLLALQGESAHQVEALQRILRLVGAEQKVGASTTLGLHRENAVAIQHEIAEADGLVEIIGQQMETLLLQIYRYEAGATELLARAEGRQRSIETLDRIQEKVDARRDAARQLIELVVPQPDLEAGVVALPPHPAQSSNGNGVHRTDAIDFADLTYRAAVDEPEPDSSGDSDGDECARLVSEALRNLHNPAVLACCELIEKLPRTLAAARARLGYDNLAEPTPMEQARTLNDVLIAALESLKPAATEDAEARHDSLQYSILSEEYVLARSTTAVMVRHGIGESTLHRHRKRAVALLAQELQAQEDRLARSTNGHA